jgi:transcriptional/translational regulatory protein YebC/TACO1
VFQDRDVELTMHETVQVPKTTVKLEKKSAEKILSLMEKLEDLDDVQNVAANFDIPDEVMHEIEQ